MIVVKITGGPGNQLFQYAFGRHLAIKNKTDLYLDISEFDIKKYRRLILHKFNIKANIADKKMLGSLLKYSNYFPYDLKPAIHRLFPSLFPDIVYERQFHFDPEMLSVKDHKYLIGFWQSEKYFSAIKKTLSEDFTLKKGLSAKSTKIMRLIKSTSSISVNVRRGDYLTNPQINKRHGVISLSYFNNAVGFMAKRVKNPHFFFFSDDISWVKEKIRTEFPSVYVDFNFPEKSQEDLMLGSRCKHHILTNSTFSWWVGWLNDNEKKLVTVPQNWFNQLKYKTVDLYPKKWIILNN